MLHTQFRGRKSGQIIALFAIVLPVLLLATGLAIDLGFAYVARAKLSKAADAAALSAMRNLNYGSSAAISAANAAFVTNYGSPAGSDAGPPSINVAFVPNSNNTVVSVTATATINTFFLRLVPQFKTLNITQTAQVTRPTFIMSLILDRSGSMNLNGGAQALPSSVTSFLTYFDNNVDEIADVSYSSTATVDYPIGTGFQTSIDAKVNSMTFGGGTFSQSGLQMGLNQITSVTVLPAQQVVKAAVFFTDGWANTIQDTLNCPPNTLLNYGGCSPPEAAVGWCSGISFINPNNGRGMSCNATSFPARAHGGGNKPLTPVAAGQQNIANDAAYRSLQVAEAMRAQNIVVYSIGLGDKISQTFLQQIANDPASPTFNPNEPVGQAAFATDSSQLQGVFEAIAAQIVARITQ